MSPKREASTRIKRTPAALRGTLSLSKHWSAEKERGREREKGEEGERKHDERDCLSLTRGPF